MPTVLRIGTYRFHFYSDEGNEPAHIHVRSSDGECKFWLDPIALASSGRMPSNQLRQIERHIFENHELLTKAYNDIHKR